MALPNQIGLAGAWGAIRRSGVVEVIRYVGKGRVERLWCPCGACIGRGRNFTKRKSWRRFAMGSLEPTARMVVRGACSAN